MKKIIRNLWPDDDGQDLAEYGILLFLISAVVIAAIILFRNQIATLFSGASDTISKAL